MKKIIIISLLSTFVLIGCSTGNKQSNNNKSTNQTELNTQSNEEYKNKNQKIMYSNLLDQEVKNQVKELLLKNKVNENYIDNFLNAVSTYNKSMSSLFNPKDGYQEYNSSQVPYDTFNLQQKWLKDHNGDQTDLNCRLTSFILFRDFINSQTKFTGDTLDIFMDIETININKEAKLNTKDKEKFINLYSSIKVKESDNLDKKIQAIETELTNRKISFLDNTNIILINGYLPIQGEDSVYVGHSGLAIKIDEGYLFLEKYGPGLPFQISKFKNKDEIKNYIFDRLKMSEGGGELPDSIIFENNKAM